MKTRAVILTIALLLTISGHARAQTVNWGDVMFSDLVDSKGQMLDNTYAVQIGAFAASFVPDASNVTQWATYWRTFDGTTINGVEPVDDDGIHGYFTSSVQILKDGKSSNTAYPDLGLNFQDMDAYLWIRKGNDAEPGSEWLLARASSWKFPAYKGCCANDPPTQWSVTDLASVTPVYGKQGSLSGAGVFTDAGNHTLQTFTFVPEPSAAVLLALAAAGLGMRRQRKP